VVLEEPQGPGFPGDQADTRDRFVAAGGFEPAPGRRGRPRKEPDQDMLTQVLRLYFIEKMSMRQVAQVVGVSHMSVYRMLSDPAVELLI